MVLVVFSEAQDLAVRFTHVDRDRDRIDVRRADGTTLGWEFPTHVSRLPHDLCHLVVEQGLDIAYGFWGLVSRGVDVRLRDGHAELAFGDAPLRDHPEVDFSDLRHSEEAVAVLSPSGLKTDTSGPLVIVTIPSAPDAQPLAAIDVERVQALFPSTSAEKLRSVRDKLIDLERQWQATGAGQSLTLAFRAPSGTP